MGGPLILGLDLGTTNAKASAFDDGGRVRAQAAAGYPTAHPGPDWHEQDPFEWQRAVGQVLSTVGRQLGNAASAIRGVGLSAHAPGLVLVDAEERALCPCPTWQDERSWPQGERLLRSAGPEWVGLGLPRTGLPAKLAWMLEHRADLAARARWAMGIKDFLGLWLTGEVATEPSSVAGGREWFGPVFSAMGWSADRLPPVRPSNSIVGRLRPHLARDWDLPPDVPVVAGLSDGAASTLGAGVLRSGDGMVSLGTNSVLRFVVPSPLPRDVCATRSLFTWPYVDDLSVAGGFTKAGGASLEWLARIVSGSHRNQSVPAACARLLERAATSPPGSRGVLFLPFLTGQGSPESNPAARAAFLGLSVEHDLADITRAVLEGVAYTLREVAGALEDWVPSGGRLTIGGGAAQSAVWRQIIADVLGRPLAFHQGDATLGAAIVAAVGVGVHRSHADAVGIMVPKGTEIDSIPGHSKVYDRGYAMYRWEKPRGTTGGE